MRLLTLLRVMMLCAAGSTAVLLLTQFRAYNAERPWPNRAMQTLDRLALADRSVERDVLSARAGLVRNYDSVTGSTVLASAQADELVRLTRGQGRLFASSQVLAARVHEREDIVERFKTDNALVQNALSRFAETNEAVRTGDARVERLAVELMRLTLHTGDSVPEATRQRLRLLASGSGGMSRPAENEFANQARLLLAVLPEIDQLLGQLKMLNSDAQIESVQRQLAAYQDLDATGRLRQLIGLAMSATLTLLIATTLMLLMRLRARNAVLQAENERLSATVANILLDPMTMSLQRRIIRSLQELASHVGADRAFLVLGDPTGQTFEWPAGPHPKPRWSSLLAQINETQWQDGLIERIYPLPTLADGNSKTPNACAMMLRATARVPTVLGFVRNDGAFELRPYGVAVLRVALAGILQAVERERLVGDRVRLERTLARARRMETVGAMASGIAHNFNNIMGAIAGFSELAIARTRAGSALRGNLNEIGLAVERGRQLAEQILSFGRRPAERDVIAIPDLIRESVPQVRVTLPEEVTLVVQEPIAETFVEGSTPQLQQVLINIATNGAHAMAGGGVIRLAAELQSLDHPLPTSHGLLEAGQYVIVSIADDGIGMNADQVAQIFQPFYTNRPGGTGLGLSTAWEVVQDCKGTIDVTSEPGRGSQFCVWLPVLRTDRIELSSGTLASLEGAGERVLLIADEAERPLLEEQIAILGYEPVSPAKVNDAVAVFDHVRRSAVDAVLLVRPGAALLEGLDRLLADRTPFIPVLVAGVDEDPAGRYRAVSWPLREGELAGTLKLAL